ncbi:AraC family transcriptional regulator [Metarhizobium album]|uniref:AraC family transcriptional regulator n=1 Tax=Metarhizobium album TaxID=2182425 RepID=A0A2U2DIV3_9HYPH|nr:AraC family transcriptional regulator [Rhizobium album]PWE53236.1 AraC family transcriptional regulator [Rhizobium album]
MSTALAVYHGLFGRATLYKLNRPMVTHAHREGHLAFFVQGAPSVITASGMDCRVDGGTASAVNPWQAHSFMPGDADGGTLFLVLYIKPIWFLEVGRSAQSALRFGRDRIIVTPQIHRLVQLVSTLLLEDEQSDLFDGYLYELTRECYDQTWQWSPDASPFGDDSTPFNQQWSGVRDYRVRNSIRLMNERIGDELALDTIARDSGLSRPHFYKLFREHAGLTPNVYLNTLRMENAIDKLTRTKTPITTIGLDLGFASQASFTRFFTANVGIPPTDYRRVAYVG